MTSYTSIPMLSTLQDPVPLATNHMHLWPHDSRHPGRNQITIGALVHGIHYKRTTRPYNAGFLHCSSRGARTLALWPAKRRAFEKHGFML